MSSRRKACKLSCKAAASSRVSWSGLNETADLLKRLSAKGLNLGSRRHSTLRPANNSHEGVDTKSFSLAVLHKRLDLPSDAMLYSVSAPTSAAFW